MTAPKPRSTDLSAAINDAHILVTTGAGGVGKTTTAAALGIAAAQAGRRALVLTIDPAKRLAQAMGLETLDNNPRPVPAVDAAGKGELHAMMLDMQSTFDALIDRHASAPDRARAIKSNRIYQTLSSTLSGTQEYMAMERLHELEEDGVWDLLIIDTPPSRSALDFLDAPKRMTSFLEGRLLHALLKPTLSAGKGYLRAVNFGATAFMKVAGKVTGMDLLTDLADFFRNFEGMYEGFKERAEEVLELLRRPDSQFVVVTSPEPPPLREARFFLERMEQEGLHNAGVVVNRIHPEARSAPPVDALVKAADTLDEAKKSDTTSHAVAGALALLADTISIAGRERRDVEAALYGRTPEALVEVPLLAGDVHDIDTLLEISDALRG